MRYLSRFSISRAFKDLRFFFEGRQPYELGFLALAMVITLAIIFAFAYDSDIPADYRPDIIYVEQYPLSRTDAEIKAQQRIDEAAKQKRLAEIRKIEEERRAAFKRLDDKLERLGI